MRRHLISLALGIAAIAISSPALPQSPAQPAISADLILQNGRLLIPGGWATAMAVAHGTIVAIGDDVAMTPYRTSSTKVIDLGGKMVMPGLHDMHVHPGGAGMQFFQCALPHDAKPAELLNIVSGCVKNAKPGDWITGRAYEAASFGKTPPNKAMLDKIAPNNPVMLNDISGHSNWANSAALKLAGITRDTPNPPNGIIERDAKGEPTGLLRESASNLVSRNIPPATRERHAEALKKGLDSLLAQGITAFDDALLTTTTAQAYSDLSDKGELKQRVRGCLFYVDQNLLKLRNYYARPRFTPSCIKMQLDGVPTDSHTAAMLEPYMPLPGAKAGDEIREKGLLMVDQAKLNALVVEFDREGLTVKFHAAGDAAVRAGLDAIAAARKANGFNHNYHNVAHNSFVNMDDIRRAKSIEATFEFSPYLLSPSPIMDDIEKAVRPDLMSRWIPIKDALDAGAMVVPGSDWPVTTSVSPWYALETMVTRQAPGGGGKVLGPEERITLKQAVELFTIASARQGNFDYATGSLETGKFADFVVIDRNIFEVPITDVHNTKVLMTYIEGEKVYDAATAPAGN
ncbi:amidohydrolase family protein [Sphingobium sp. H33]|uniref:Amidohydrolase family protein n=1 Tax=Sphingobium nicotianae TaxID=2782607 RepID=A0A9X1DG53_9SPHN|nr:amidohydrolase family protein [Sphingobium nicotianae]